MISLSEEVTIPSPPDRVWPLLSDPAVVASCIPGAALTNSGEDGAYQGTVRVKFGPTVALFRGEARLTYDHEARRCTIEGRGIDGRGQSRAVASGVVSASGSDVTVLKIAGSFNVTGPLETFANAGGIHVARALLAEFSQNMAKLVAGPVTAPHPDPLPEIPGSSPGREREGPAPQAWEGEGQRAPAELRAGKLLWRAFLGWLRQIFSGKGQRESR
jgi:carbon monoxide dehydrogenase subunit G